MNDLIEINSTSTKTMTSSQLAEMLHKEKKEVNRDIRKMFQDRIDGGIITPSKDSRGYVVDYYLPELESKMFVAKKDINYLEKITRFWIEQNKKNYSQPKSLPYWVSEADGVEYLLSKFNAPKSIIAAETMKHVYHVGGPDLRDKVGELPCAQNIPEEEIMLEPTELGKIFGLSGIKMNRLLESLGLQEKVNNSWEPTKEGAQICSRHYWSSAGKSGYNYKWVKSKVEALLQEQKAA